MSSSDLKELVDTYFPQIEVYFTGFNQVIPANERSPDVPDLALIVPNEMLRKYSAIKGLENIPNDATFLKETKLLEKLHEYRRNIQFKHLPLPYILGRLKDAIHAEHGEVDSQRTMIFISEI